MVSGRGAVEIDAKRKAGGNSSCKPGDVPQRNRCIRIAAGQTSDEIASPRRRRESRGALFI
ncbi:hypothetical protein PLANPX_5302 [Lacipirellula parvula]|uniref:Uncharacterized protein n=1 Tax=Lacipirellula parvula TaxID=2650471 RepID=A0A5K7XFU8_9BACT|nr:hypothetical protein PLANPX_5302 [Lacipirellula parvula]